MISFVTGDILTSSAHCLVNTVNCEGYMGKGIAYQFKKKFPENNKNYVAACKAGTFTVGNILFFSEKDKMIANFPTKNKWKEKSKYSYIKDGLFSLAKGIEANKIQSIAIPPLGCGNGGLDWNRVKQMITESLKDSSANIIIYEPSKIFIPQKIEIPKMTASHLVLMRIKAGLTPANFGSLRLQKSAFFLNIFSNTDYFKFTEYKYGPYSHPIEILSRQIKAFQDTYNVNTSGAEKILYNNIISDTVKTTLEKFQLPILKSTNFVNSINSNLELETVATIVSIVKSHPNFTKEEIADYFLNNWPKEDVNRFTRNAIERSLERLITSNIITPQLIGYSLSKNITENSFTLPVYKM